MRLGVARALMRLPHPVWVRLPDRLRSWAVDQWLWQVPSVQRLYPSRSAMRQRLARTVDALDPGGA